MPTHKPYTQVSTLPTNSGGERTILEAHLDSAHGTITDVLERLTQTLFTVGGVVVPGAVTNPSAALVQVVGRMGVSSDCLTLLAVADSSVDLASVASGIKCLIVIRAGAGASTSHTFTDPTTGEVIVHSLLSQWGRLETLQGDASNYPALPTDCVPVAEVTKTGAATLTLDTVITTEPTLRYAGGGGSVWGSITGTLSEQADVQTALNARLSKLALVKGYAGNRTLDADDSGAYVRVTAAGTVALPDGLATGFQCVIVNATASATVQLSAATTLTLPSGFEPEIQNRRAVTVIHVGSGVWEAHGALVETP